MKSCSDACFLYLTFARSEQEVRVHLTHLGYPDHEIEEAIQKSKEIGYIDDEEFSRAYVLDHIRLNRWGRHKISYALSHKGIATDVVNHIIDDHYEDYETALEESIAKKVGTSDVREPKVRDKVYRHLNAKGFSLEDIRRGLQNYDEKCADEREDI